MKLSLRPQAVQAMTGGIRHRFLRLAAVKVGIVQEEQVAEAFDSGGQPSAKWAPLWANSFVATPPKQAIAKAARKIELAEKKGDAVTLTKAVEKFKALGTSYRKGGEPLRDNGHLAASFHLQDPIIADTYARTLIKSAVFYAQYHQTGFSTKGPNFIPLTLKARRTHKREANPEDEGLEWGVDYIIAWHGVTVPARPMIDYADPVNKSQIEQAIRSALKEAAQLRS